jgi:hypothetical protein
MERRERLEEEKDGIVSNRERQRGRSGKDSRRQSVDRRTGETQGGKVTEEEQRGRTHRKKHRS